MNNPTTEQSTFSNDAGGSGVAFYAKAFSLPLILLVSYFVARLFNLQPTIEINGLSDLFRDLYLFFGCSVAYFMFLLQQSVRPISVALRGTYFWILSSLLMLFILLDDVLMLHEQFGELFGISDKVLLLIHGGMLIALLLAYRTRLIRAFWLSIGIFGAFSVAAILLDNTATYWHIGGRDIDLEQIFEVFGLLAMSTAFTAQAISELRADG